MQEIAMRSFEDVLANIDLSKVMQHYAEETGATEEEKVRAEHLYRNFLLLMKRRPELNIVPPKIIDDVWHTHITFTRSYMDHCQRLYGKYVHHEVVDSSDNSWKDHHYNFTKTFEAFGEEFGIDLNSVLTPSEKLVTRCVRG